MSASTSPELLRVTRFRRESTSSCPLLEHEGGDDGSGDVMDSTAVSSPTELLAQCHFFDEEAGESGSYTDDGDNLRQLSGTVDDAEPTDITANLIDLQPSICKNQSCNNHFGALGHPENPNSLVSTDCAEPTGNAYNVHDQVARQHSGTSRCSHRRDSSTRRSLRSESVPARYTKYVVKHQPNVVNTSSYSEREAINNAHAQLQQLVQVQPYRTKYKLLNEHDACITRVQHCKSLYNKLLQNKYIRLWEVHRLMLDDDAIRSLKASGCMSEPIHYSCVHDVNYIAIRGGTKRYCVRVITPCYSLLILTSSAYIRDQWINSIVWKKNLFRYTHIVRTARRPEVWLRAIKELIEIAMATPLYDQSLSQKPLELVSELLRKDDSEMNLEDREQVIVTLAPFLENRHPTQEICDFFIKHCRSRPRSTLVIELFSDVVKRILKINTDFGKFPRSRTFVQEYLFALTLQNDPQTALKNFVRSVHGPCSHCPFPRVLPNLISICLSGITRCYTTEDVPRGQSTAVCAGTRIGATGNVTSAQRVSVAVNQAMMKASSVNVNVNVLHDGSSLALLEEPRATALKFSTNGGVAMSPRKLLFCENYLSDATNRPVGDADSMSPSTNPFRPFILTGLCANSSSTDPDTQNHNQTHHARLDLDDPLLVGQDDRNRNLLRNLASPSEFSLSKVAKGVAHTGTALTSTSDVPGNSAAGAASFSISSPLPPAAAALTSSAAYAHTMKDEQSDLHKQRVLCYVTVLNEVAAHADWRPTLASILQPIPFPEKALRDRAFTAAIKPAIRAVAHDPNCDVHSRLLAIREGKDGWFHLYCPGAQACDDDGELFCTVLGTLYNCCCKRRRFLESLLKHVSSLLLLALREHADAIDVLCAILEFELISNNQAELKLHIVTALQSTETGKQRYNELCERQIRAKEAQSNVGPRKLSLPPKSTDADLSRVLAGGQFSQLECLSLAFTNVTSGCARDLIQLRNLRYLNLWTTQFSDSGVLMIAEHLHQLQVLNLCETQVTDKGALALTALKKLRKLNLNSTQLSAATFEKLKEKLPLLQEVDVRYTDAW